MKLNNKSLDYVNLKRFVLDGNIPLNNYHFFAKHFSPYAFIKDIIKSKSILEIGFGDGYGLSYLSEFAKNYSGMDLRLHSCVAARKKYGLKNLINMDATKFGFKPESLDVIYCFQVIEHISQELVVNFLINIREILKKDGMFISSTLNLKNNLKNPDTYSMFSEHEKEYTIDEFRSLLEGVFPSVEIYGLFRTLKHSIFLRLKKWGFLKYNMFGKNPVRNFYDNISTSDFRVSKCKLEQAVDFIAICKSN